MSAPSGAAAPSGGAMRRAVSDADKGRRRDELLAAARDTFATKGYHGTTMADVARAADLSYGVAYWYFDSKDDLFKAVMSAEAGALRARIGASLTDVAPSGFREVLTAAVAATFAYFDENPAAGVLLFREPVALGHDVERHLLDIFEGFIGALGRGMGAGAADVDVAGRPMALTAFVVATLISSVALRRSRTDDGMSADEAAAYVVGLVFDGIGRVP
ncbi:MAG: TetR/AcrR family transcriptional regulator [Acidimicrobiales bacterium]|nr:TetR/AcrR family transcriptional regulator [Acidimicrobiales bacterium]MCB1249788.1 TetR/AcrR family transcriptional regulator [Acidimicrobiales bacterium]MCB1259847.1 TetR/AcrR family transcriptional regulator [Acidimicrobiales bacterium]